MAVPPQGQLNRNLLPELYPIVFGHIPLHATPSTLLSLALTNRYHAQVVTPLLYSCLILKSNEDAMPVLRRLDREPMLGLLVRSFHVLFNQLDGSKPNCDPSQNILALVQDLIQAGRLPFIHTFEMNFRGGWDPWHSRYDEKYDRIEFYGFRDNFFLTLHHHCPRVTSIILRGLLDGGSPEQKYSGWVEDSGLFEVLAGRPCLENFSLRLHQGCMTPFGVLVHNLSQHGQILHTLSLTLPVQCNWHDDATEFLMLDFPSLRSLTLECFGVLDTHWQASMNFFTRHPSITYLNVALNTPGLWFSAPLPDHFLPSLRHLTVDWLNCRGGYLAALFPQLHSLCITDSTNAEIPHLFRVVVGTPLLNLKSLELGQNAREIGCHSYSPEAFEELQADGTIWYETVDGEFVHDINSCPRKLWDGYMHSIFRAAPNLEELGFHQSGLTIKELLLMSDDLKMFPHLKHLHYEVGGDWEINDSDSTRESFREEARLVANAIPGLLSITEGGEYYDPPYRMAKILRTEDTEIADVIVCRGFGMKVGREDWAFPRAPYDFGGMF